MTDLELLDKYCETCLEFPHPVIFREIESRGLVSVVNHLPPTATEAKSIVRARLSKVGRYVGDPEIEQIADCISRLESLRTELQRMNLADAHRVLPVLAEMQYVSRFVKDYFKPSLQS